jgi:hypothetical protein
MFSKELIIKLDEKSELIYFPEFLNAEDSDYYFDKFYADFSIPGHYFH